MIDEQSLAMASSGRLSELEVCWQFEQNLFMGESRWVTRWVNMPPWLNGAAEQGYKIHHDLIARGGDPRLPPGMPWSKFKATYRGNPDGPITFEFTYENIYFMISLKAKAWIRIRRIIYMVTAP